MKIVLEKDLDLALLVAGILDNDLPPGLPPGSRVNDLVSVPSTFRLTPAERLPHMTAVKMQARKNPFKSTLCFIAFSPP